MKITKFELDNKIYHLITNPDEIEVGDDVCCGKEHNLYNVVSVYSNYDSQVRIGLVKLWASGSHIPVYKCITPKPVVHKWQHLIDAKKADPSLVIEVKQYYDDDFRWEIVSNPKFDCCDLQYRIQPTVSYQYAFKYKPASAIPAISKYMTEKEAERFSKTLNSSEFVRLDWTKKVSE